MGSLLSRLPLRKQIGMVIGDREIVASELARTPLGRVEVFRERMAIEADGLAPAVGRLLNQRFSRKDLERARVAISVPAMRVFFSTRPVRADQREATPQVLLHEVLQSPSLNIDDMVVDLIKLKSGPQTLASIAACRKKYLVGVLEALEVCGISPSRTEPAPCPLIRSATRRLRPPRKSPVFVRVFLGSTDGLAVLMTRADVPLLWREFSFTEGDEATAIQTAVTGLGTLERCCGFEGDIKVVLIHGRPDLGPLAKVVAVPALRGARVVRHDAPALDDGVIALGLAEGTGQGVAAFNLSRTVGRAVSFLEVFPWGQVFIQAAMLLAVTLFLQSRLSNAEAATRTARAEDAKFVWAAKLDATKLQSEKTDLEQKIEAIRKFLDTRIVWTAYAHDLSNRLPSEIVMASFLGQSDLEATGGKPTKINRSLLLKLEAPIPKAGAMPKEIDAYLRTLRDDPLLKRDFPVIEMGDLRWAQATPGRAIATFNVTCQPAAKAPPPKAPAADVKKHK